MRWSDVSKEDEEECKKISRIVRVTGVEKLTLLRERLRLKSDYGF